MLSKSLNYVSHHAIAILALICSLLALAGASYAALKLPKNSVGTKQLRRGAVTSIKLRQGAVTPAKLAGKKFGGYVRAWAHVDASGKLVSSNPKASIHGWQLGGTSDVNAGNIDWKPRIPRSCIPIATTDSVPVPSYASATTSFAPPKGFGTQVSVALSRAVGVYVIVVC